jgi:hypothetical protein
MDTDDPEAYASLARCLKQVGQDAKSQDAAARYAELTAAHKPNWLLSPY